MTEATAVYVRAGEAAGPGTEQRERALTYATETLGLPPETLRVLRDTGVEAGAQDAAGYRRLVALATHGDIDRVIITDGARVARNIPDLHEFVTEFVENGIGVHIIEAGLQVGDAGTDGELDDETALQVLGAAAELATTINSELTKEGLSAARDSGSHIGRPPFGFDSDGDGGIVPNDDFETAVGVIERMEAGKSKRSTAKRADISRATVQKVLDRKELYLDRLNEAETAD